MGRLAIFLSLLSFNVIEVWGKEWWWWLIIEENIVDSFLVLFFRTVTNMFIMNLAAADLLVLVFCLPATVVQDVTKTWFFGLILCKFVNYIQVLFYPRVKCACISSSSSSSFSARLNKRQIIGMTRSIPIRYYFF